MCPHFCYLWSSYMLSLDPRILHFSYFLAILAYIFQFLCNGRHKSSTHIPRSVLMAISSSYLMFLEQCCLLVQYVTQIHIGNPWYHRNIFKNILHHIHHQMISFETSHIGLAPTPFSQRLNDSLLTDPSIIKQITTHIEEYFSHNSIEDIPPYSLWSAHKAVLRGHLINIASIKNKTRLSDVKRLTKDLDSLYNKISQTPSQELTHQIQTKRQELDSILPTNIEKFLRFSKAKYIETQQLYLYYVCEEDKPRSKTTPCLQIKRSEG